MEEKVSIIIPTYNRAAIIGETLDSIIAQGYTHWECIIVDDGSEDNSDEIIKKYTDSDLRFRYFKRPSERTKGANACRNYGFEMATGTYVKWFDSDDLMHPDFLSKQVETLNQNSGIEFCASAAKIFHKTVSDAADDFNPEKTGCENALYHFITGKLFFLTPSPLWRKHFLNGKLLYDESLYNAHESDFNFRRLTEGAKFIFLPAVLFYVRRGHDSIDSSANTNVESIQSQLVYFDKIYRFLLGEHHFFNPNQRKALLHYTLYRSLLLYYKVAVLGHKKYTAANYNILRSQIKSGFLTFGQQTRLHAGILLIRFFSKGFGLIHMKTFDLR